MKVKDTPPARERRRERKQAANRTHIRSFLDSLATDPPAWEDSAMRDRFDVYAYEVNDD